MKHDSNSLEVRRLRESDRGALVEGDGGSRSPAPIRYREDYFAWHYEGNPFLSDGFAQIWVCEDNQHIVGQMSGMPVRLKAGGQELRASWAHDLLVNGSYRGRGIGGKLDAACMSDNPVTLGIGVSEAAYRVHLRMGWLDLGTLPIYVRPLDCAAVLGRRREGRGAALAGTLCNPFLKGLGTLCRRIAEKGRFSLAPIERFDDQGDDIWRQSAPHYPVLCRRDAEYLNWRFASDPVRSDYRPFYLLRDQSAVGYVVLSRERREGLDAGIVVDYLCPPQWSKALFALCTSLCYEWKTQALYCTHLNPHPAFDLRCLGFLRRKSDSLLMVCPTGVDEHSKELISRRESWFVTSGDSDVHRPEGSKRTASGGVGEPPPVYVH